ncbi:prepilin-type N-terminal cleavage/methylation domain-containing protein [Sinimarinibacterium sp. CAU 1509]|uniref:GspH/FimT family pseudopilin n=1 Tax=Sinimarinibacterium sp. CAU 1509 TaxID=2562283 RepID=UPI0011377A09|nr:GspH/FimT family pseudopilin [Sinimarinibacterium sp. CAU 1509]TJY62072.1 prepilin-type N-terminal cleavage/methylation domain-containing protein [Sinimarinibacterium sp. CAU 1509]
MRKESMRRRVSKVKAIVRGFTLLELMVTITVLGILVALAVPSYSSLINRNRVRNAAEQMRSDFSLARSEALRRSNNVTLSFTRSADGATWCYGLNTGGNCDCTATTGANVCALDVESGVRIRRVVDSGAYRGVSMTNLTYSGCSTSCNLTLNPVRPTMAGGTVQFTSMANQVVRVVTTSMGRIRLCSPSGAGHVIYFETC